ncbi:MAG TPA: hypothetical protein VF188_13200 [Longimicrobiales bacterium]
MTGALAAAGLLALLAGACADNDVTTPDAHERARSDDPVSLGLVEVTITGIGTGNASASALSAPSLAELGALHAARAAAAPGGLALQSLAPVANIDDSGDGTIQLDPLATGSFTDGERGSGGVRYLYATFRVRNAQANGTPYDTPRHNLTFLAVDTDGTIGETAISSMQHFEGSPAESTLAPEFLPTGGVARNAASGEIEPNGADVLQVLTEAEAADVLAAAPTGVTTVFPYGFVTRCVANCIGGRTLQESPAADQFDGVVTFAFKVPLQTDPADDPFTVSVVVLAVDDSEMRITESLEEQGTTSVAVGADALGPAASVTLLGNSTTLVPGHGIRRICRVRTAGTDPSAPLAALVDAGASCTEGAVSLPDNVIVVDDDAAAGGDGRTWATAFNTLQDALTCARDENGGGEACEGVDEIWVAAGTYYPDEGDGQTNNDLDARFELIEGVSLYGGFAGVEYAREQRDWTANPTVLDGDIDQSGDINGNATHVIYGAMDAGKITRATVVDGFTIRSGTDFGLGGGAFYCVATGAGSTCSPTLRNVVASGNTGASGGAFYLGAFSGGDVSPLLRDVTFTDNGALFRGGALFVTASAATASPVVIRTTFTGDSAQGDGGAVSVLRDIGGTIEIDFVDVIFRENRTDGSGGAVDVSGVSSSPTTLRFVDTEFWNNEAADNGGAIMVGGATEVTLTGVTVAGNEAQGGFAIDISGTDDANLTNTIVWGNSQFDESLPPIYLGSGSGSAQNVLIQHGCPTGLTCTNLIDANPQFADLDAGDLRLAGSSPAVDAGDTDLLPTDIFDLDGDGDIAEPLPLDLAGRPRAVDWAGDDGAAAVDLGAYERQ